jgi:GxxExxY protein
MGEKEEINRITEAIIGAAINVHKALGPGLLESAYEACTAYELVERGLKIEQLTNCCQFIRLSYCPI